MKSIFPDQALLCILHGQVDYIVGFTETRRLFTFRHNVCKTRASQKLQTPLLESLCLQVCSSREPSLARQCQRHSVSASPLLHAVSQVALCLLARKLVLNKTLGD